MTNPTDPVYASNCSAHGLTKREYFAAMAMQGLCANAMTTYRHKDGLYFAANSAVNIADALIAELNKQEEHQ